MGGRRRRPARRATSAGAMPGRRPTDAEAVSPPSRTQTCCSDTSAPRRRWPGRPPRPEAARAVGTLAGELGLDVLAAAAGIVRVADEEMLRALRVATVQRGVDPRGYALVAFGGAGPMHAARLAEQLGVRRVLCPPAAGLLSALGLATADRRRDTGRSLLLDEAEIAQGRAAAMRELAGRRAPACRTRLEANYDMRYRGQSFELEVTAAPDAGVAELRELFEQAHEHRYGYRDPEGRIELVNARVSAIEERAPAAVPSAPRRGDWSAASAGRCSTAAPRHHGPAWPGGTG